MSAHNQHCDASNSFFTKLERILHRKKDKMQYTTKAVASGVKGGDDYRGARVRGRPRGSQLTGWGQPKKTLRTGDWPLLCVVTKAYHLQVFFSLANLKILKSLKHSNKRRGKAQLITRAPCSVHTQRATSHGQQERTELSFASSCAWTNKYTSQFKHANRKKDAKESTSAHVCGVLCAQGFKQLEYRIYLFYKIMSKYPSWRVSSKKLSFLS